MPTPSRTSLEDIVASARRILETGGLDDLTMQRVASAVGVRAPSLYKHVRSRNDLVRLVTEDVARQLAEAIAAASSANPADDLPALASAFRSFAHAHPRAYSLVFGPLPDAWRPDLGSLAPANDAMMRTAASLAGRDRALEGARLVVAWAHGFVSMELAGAFRLGGNVDEAFAFGVERLRVALTGASGGASSGAA